ncbi:hypothetical protein [Desulfosporosinus fructosivorans]
MQPSCHNDSDFDIYVVIPDESMRPIEAMQKIGGAILSTAVQVTGRRI